MSLLGLVANIRIAGGPDRCIRICSQFLVTSQSQIISKNFFLLMASVVHPFEGCRGAAKAASAKAAGQQTGTPSLQRGVQHEQVSIGMVGK